MRDSLLASKRQKMPKNVGQKIGVFGEFLESCSVFGVVWSVLERFGVGENFYIYTHVKNSPGESLKMNDFVFRGGGNYHRCRHPQ